MDDDLPLLTVTATDSVASEQGPNAGTFTVTRSGAVATLTVPAEAVSGQVAVTNAAGTTQSSGTFTIRLGIVSFAPARRAVSALQPVVRMDRS